MDWTPERTNELMRYVEAHMTATQIAKAMGCGLTRNAIVGRAHRMNLAFKTAPIPEWPQERIDDLKQRVADNEPLASIGREYGMSATSVWEKIKRLGIERPERVKRANFNKPSPSAPRTQSVAIPDGGEPPATAKPWTERRTFFECAWPYGEGESMLSCCADSDGAIYCSTHARLAYNSPHVKGNAYVRGLRRYA